MPVIHTKGGRKRAIARLYIAPKKGGTLLVNHHALEEYFIEPFQRTTCLKPFEVLDQVGKYEVKVYVKGGGKSAQSQAVAHAAARALVQLLPDTKATLKEERLLARDPRQKERKKYGLRKARKRTQWTKR